MNGPEGVPLLELRDVTVEYDVGLGQVVHALTNVDLTVRRGEILGLVGESGCGKSTLSRTVMQLVQPTSGSVIFDGERLNGLSSKDLRARRRRFQVILQDAVSSLNPRRRVRDLVGEGLVIRGETDDLGARVDKILTAVGLDPLVVGDRRPRELSGGQCQRVCIARALVLEPELLVCDEPVSALDVLVQAQILNLIAEVKREFDLTLLFVSHDLLVVRHVSDRVAVMYLGRLCEVGPAKEVFDRPQHPYTQLLLAAIPEVANDGTSDWSDQADMPSPIDPPSGCRFRTRCPAAHDRCAVDVPQLRTVAPDHVAACHLLEDHQ